jgi:hypothetical protein
VQDVAYALVLLISQVDCQRVTCPSCNLLQERVELKRRAEAEEAAAAARRNRVTVTLDLLGRKVRPSLPSFQIVICLHC